MRIAILSDVHGNLTALEAVVADLREAAPDLTLHGGDLAYSGSLPAEVVDQIRALGLRGVLGNADEILVDTEAIQRVASQHPTMADYVGPLEEMAAAGRDALGDERLAWLRSMPTTINEGPLALVHASPNNLWQSPAISASDAELESVYLPLGRSLAVFGHIHEPFIRRLPRLIVANSGSVGQSFDGDPRASYLLIDDGVPTIRRVAYDLEKEIAARRACAIPQADWIIRTLRAARRQAL